MLVRGIATRYGLFSFDATAILGSGWGRALPVRAQGGFVRILPGKLAPVEPAFAIYADEYGETRSPFARDVTSEVFALLRDPASWE